MSTWCRFAPSEHAHGGVDPTKWVDVRLTFDAGVWTVTARHGRAELAPLSTPDCDAAWLLFADALDAAGEHLSRTGAVLAQEARSTKPGEPGSSELWRLGELHQAEARLARGQAELLRNFFV